MVSSSDEKRVVISSRTLALARTPAIAFLVDHAATPGGVIEPVIGFDRHSPHTRLPLRPDDARSQPSTFR